MFPDQLELGIYDVRSSSEAVSSEEHPTAPGNPRTGEPAADPRSWPAFLTGSLDR